MKQRATSAEAAKSVVKREGTRPKPAGCVEPAAMPWVPMPECLSRWTGFVLCWVANLGGQFYETSLAPLQLRPGQLAILTLLESEGAIVQARLGERLRIDKATMVGLLNDLERQKLVERRPCAHDRRAFEIHLLELGRQRIQAAEQVSIAAAKQFFGMLSAAEQQTLHHLLVQLATGSASLIAGASSDRVNQREEAESPHSS